MSKDKKNDTKETKKQSIKKNKIIDICFIIITILSSIYLIYGIIQLGPIEKLIRYLFIGIIVIFDLIITINLFRKKKKKKSVKKAIKRFFLILLIIIYLFLGYNLNYITSKIANMNKKYVTNSTALVTLKSNEVNDIKDIIGATIAIGSNVEDLELYVLPMEIIKNNKLDENNKNKIVEYEDYQSMIRDLYIGEVDYIFLPSNYGEIYGEMEEYKDLEDNTKIITTAKKETTKEESNLLGTSKDISEPFTILLLGVDSTANGIKNANSFNGDSIILVTFNPDTLNATMLSIPRDTYVPIACFSNKAENKITHAAAHGASCVIKTVENYTGIKIDYYAKINFTGLVDLVNAVGGIEVDVPYALCEQNSKRKWGSNTVYVEKGLQKLNGEQALALARNRKKNSKNHLKCDKKYLQGTRNDFIRGQNQQLVIQGILNEVKNIKSINEVYSILDAISNNLDTNMKKDTILSFYNIAKDILTSTKNENGDLVTIQKLYLAGSDQYIYDERSGLELYNYIPNQESKRLIVNAMKANLGQTQSTPQKTFDYQLDKPYSTTIIGKYPGKSTILYKLIPDFTTYTKASAQSWAVKNGFEIEFKEIESNQYAEGKIISQNYHRKKRIDLVKDKKLVLTIVKHKQDASHTLD